MALITIAVNFFAFSGTGRSRGKPTGGAVMVTVFLTMCSAISLYPVAEKQTNAKTTILAIHNKFGFQKIGSASIDIGLGRTSTVKSLTRVFTIHRLILLLNQKVIRATNNITCN